MMPYPRSDGQVYCPAYHLIENCVPAVRSSRIRPLKVIRDPRRLARGIARLGAALPPGLAALNLLEGGLVIARALGLGVDGGPEVDDKGEDVEGEDEGDDPLEDGGDVVVARPVGGDEADGQEELDDDEDELYPEGDAEDAVLAPFWSRSATVTRGMAYAPLSSITQYRPPVG